ncbi:hypothetical protein AYI68_g309 [Smittium mucronatum]|uniref:Uncharacterized protein n=1 Tax=Smittium mucronatum TaxID=133383 RepID=A0A1R0H8K9_9FUNG|nr:hypothetical protein AYI68_g309 [Smittium mucronatum]
MVVEGDPEEASNRQTIALEEQAEVIDINVEIIHMFSGPYDALSIPKSLTSGNKDRCRSKKRKITAFYKQALEFDNIEYQRHFL